MATILTTKKDYPSLLGIINEIVDKELKAQNKDVLYIDYLNKDNNFREARQYFDTYEQAEQWAKSKLGNFNPDMIKYL